MKDAYYFPHDSNARNDQRIIKLRMKYGNNGYAVYFMIIEILRDAADYTLSMNDISSISYDVRETGETIEDIINNFGLFIVEGDLFYSASLKRRMGRLDAIREKRAYAGKMSGISRKQTNAEHNTNKHGTSVEQVLNSKVKHSKVNKSIVKKSIKKHCAIVFEKFWDKYNFKVDKPGCEKIWYGKNKNGVVFDDGIRTKIIKHLELYVKHTNLDGSYPGRKNPKTYLNNNGWDDDIVGSTNGYADFRLDSTGNAYIGYCDKCNVSSFYKKEDLYGDSKCCNSKILKERVKNDKKTDKPIAG